MNALQKQVHKANTLSIGVLMAVFSARIEYFTDARPHRIAIHGFGRVIYTGKNPTAARRALRRAAVSEMKHAVANDGVARAVKIQRVAMELEAQMLAFYAIPTCTV